MRNILFGLMICLFPLFSAAQEHAEYNHYVIYPSLINPGAITKENLHSVFVNYRTHWSGFDNNQNLITLQYEGPLSEKAGISARIFNEKIASLSRFKAQLGYAYKLKFENYTIGLGLSGEYETRKLTSDILQDPNLDPNDPVVASFAGGYSYFNANFGAHATTKSGIFIDFALPKFIIAPFTEGDNGNYPLLQSFIIGGGKRFNIDQNVKFGVIPSIYVRKIYSDNPPTYIDFNLLFSFLENNLVGGLMYKVGTNGLGSALGLTLGASFKGISLNYSYDAAFYKFQQYNNGSHELTVGVNFGKQ